MIGEERRTGGLIGFLASLAIHLSVATIMLWPGGQVLHVSPAKARDAVAAAAATPPQPPTPARPAPSTMDSTRKRFGLTPRQDQHPRLWPESVRAARPPSDASKSPLERDAATVQALADQWSSRPEQSLFQPIAKLAGSVRSRASEWMTHLWQSTVFTGQLAGRPERRRRMVRVYQWHDAARSVSKRSKSSFRCT